MEMIKESIAFLSDYPTWYKALGFFFFSGLVLWIGGLALVSHGQTTPAATPPASAPLPSRAPDSAASKPTPAPLTSIPGPNQGTSEKQTAFVIPRGVMDSLEAFEAHEQALRTRFAELDSFHRATQGHRVTWSGYVSNVYRMGNDTLSIRCYVDAAGFLGMGMFINVSSDLETFVYSLQRGDMVEASGTLSGSSTMKTINATSLRRCEPDKEAGLSADATRLLKEAAHAVSGAVLLVPFVEGTQLQVGSTNFMEQGNPRSEARWRSALEELIDQGLVEDRTGKMEAFFLTRGGFDLASRLQS